VPALHFAVGYLRLTLRVRFTLHLVRLITGPGLGYYRAPVTLIRLPASWISSSRTGCVVTFVHTVTFFWLTVVYALVHVPRLLLFVTPGVRGARSCV